MFSADIAKWADKVDLELNDAVVAVCAQVSKDVIFDTPVGDVGGGRLRGNWYASINVDIKDTSDTRRESESLSDANSIAQKAYGNSFILMNNLPYAYRIEYEGWSHTKAPSGMVRKNVAKIARKLK